MGMSEHDCGLLLRHQQLIKKTDLADLCDSRESTILIRLVSFDRLGGAGERQFPR
jgi:hypothetical protein